MLAKGGTEIFLKFVFPQVGTGKTPPSPRTGFSVTSCVSSLRNGVVPVVSDVQRERVVERPPGFDPVLRSPDRPAAVGTVGAVG